MAVLRIVIFLTRVELPTTISHIGQDAFKNTMIKSINIPEELISIGKGHVINEYKDLTEIQLPPTSQMNEKKKHSTTISTITTPEGVTSIGKECFNGCSSLTNVQLPSSLLSIGDYAFYSIEPYILFEKHSSKTKKLPLKYVEVPKNCKIGKCSFENSCEVVLK